MAWLKDARRACGLGIGRSCAGLAAGLVVVGDDGTDVNFEVKPLIHEFLRAVDGEGGGFNVDFGVDPFTLSALLRDRRWGRRRCVDGGLRLPLLGASAASGVSFSTVDMFTSCRRLSMMVYVTWRVTYLLPQTVLPEPHDVLCA